MKREELVSKVQAAAGSIDALSFCLSDVDDASGLSVYADMLSISAQKLLEASQNLETYAQAEQELRQAAQRVVKGGQA